MTTQGEFRQAINEVIGETQNTQSFSANAAEVSEESTQKFRATQEALGTVASLFGSYAEHYEAEVAPSLGEAANAAIDTQITFQRIFDASVDKPGLAEASRLLGSAREGAEKEWDIAVHAGTENNGAIASAIAKLGEMMAAQFTLVAGIQPTMTSVKAASNGGEQELQTYRDRT